MHWREQIAQLEHEGNFDIAIFLLEKVIKENPDNMDAYITLLFRLMDTIVEGSCYWHNVSQDPLWEVKNKYYKAKEQYYAQLGAHYFIEGYAKYFNNPEYLCVCGYTLVMEPWSFDVDDAMRDSMLRKAHTLEPNNPLYKGEFYQNLYCNNPSPAQLEEIITWAQLINEPSSPLHQWDGKGVAWEYAQGMINSFSIRVLNEPNFGEHSLTMKDYITN